ncbi:MAG TPA: ATP-binding protein [Solirubrobacteraceae bacterium]|nr:ATP-binding protein [Solirubrobacteraceae bacterium]
MTVTLADLRPVDLFDDIDDDQLAEWAAVCEPREYAAGDVIAEQGEETRAVFLLEGTAEARILDGDRFEPAGRHVAPTWMGAISVLSRTGLGVRMEALTDCRAAIVEPDDFRRLALAHPGVHEKVMRQVAPVMTRVTAIGQNRERLAALGTMAAGLAHELNNPAAAAQRAAAQLAEALDVVSSALGSFVESGVERAEAEVLLGLQREAIAGAAGRTKLDALDSADAEDELLDRLEALGVSEAWRLAEPLAGAGVDQAWLNRVAAAAGPATDAAVGWVAATLTAQNLAAELQESTRRMSDLVGAVKAYAYVDRGAVVEVDLHEGLETTLAVLGHKLKHTSIDVRREYDRSLPRLLVRGPELNQVWTNLLDNAIDALGEHGTITITTCRDGDSARVDISDDGPGVPPEARERLFEAFFTTKDVGRGTGLGLATAWRIVVDRHGGALTFDSEPGRTTFHVALPIPAVA